MRSDFWRAEPLPEYWRYRELFYFLVWRDVKIRYKQTILGVLWAIIQPLFTMIVFTVFFGYLAGIRSDGVPYPLFSYTGLVAWTYFAGAVTYAGNSLISNAGLFTKVYFPRVAIPTAAVLSGLPDFAIASVLLVGIMQYYGIPLDWGILLWPVMLVLLVLLALGVSLFLAALNVRFRDVKYAIPFVIQLWLFVTPIIYPSTLVPERVRWMIALNPLTGIIEGFRAAIMPSQDLDWRLFGISASVTIAMFVAGTVFFRRAEPTFADTV